MDKNARGKTLALSFLLFLGSPAFGASGVFKDFPDSISPAPANVSLSFPSDVSSNISLPDFSEAKALAEPALFRDKKLKVQNFFSKQKTRSIASPFARKQGSIFSRFFDGLKYQGSLLPQSLPKPLDLPPGLSEAMDLEADSLPKSAVRRNLWDGEDADGFLKNPIELHVNPKDEFAVEKVLREKIDTQKSHLGISSLDLSTVYVTAHSGAPNRADTLYAYFRQKKDVRTAGESVISLPIWGAYVAATIKVVKGRAFLVSLHSNLYSGVDLPQKPILRDQDLNEAVHARFADSPETLIRFLGRTVIERRGRWRAVNLYRKKGLPLTIAADLFSGDVFIWDNDGSSNSLGLPPDIADHLRPMAAAKGGNQMSSLRLMSAHKAEGQILAMAESDDHRPEGKMVLSPQPLPYLHLTIDGREYTTDENGRFSSEIHDSEATIKARLSGLFTEVVDEKGAPIEISAHIHKGSDNVALFNPEGMDPLTVNQVNAYVADSRHRAWLRGILNSDHRLDYRTTIRVNSPESGNAWYSSESGDIHSDRASEEYSDTGKIGILFHEMTHKADDMIHNPPSGFFMNMFKRARAYFSYHYKLPVLDHPAGIMPNAGLGEGWGDIVSMFMLDTHLIGEGFLKKQNPDWIRSGENDYQFNPQDEIHQQGLAWMGFAWDLRKSLVEGFGKDKGARIAAELIIPVLFGYMPDIPSAITHVLLNAMDRDGNILYEEPIRAAAKAHGIDLPSVPRLPL